MKNRSECNVGNEEQILITDSGKGKKVRGNQKNLFGNFHWSSDDCYSGNEYSVCSDEGIDYQSEYSAVNAGILTGTVRI